MTDNEILELFRQRNETAISECDIKYGAYCMTIAHNILGSREDCEECVNDTWVNAWNSIPPKSPPKLSAFLGRITRNLAIDRYRQARAVKRRAGQTALCLEELSECISDKADFTDEVALKDITDRFLLTLKPESRELFMLRYWYMLPIAEIARRRSLSTGAVKMSLARTRKAFGEFLEKEGIC